MRSSNFQTQKVPIRFACLALAATSFMMPRVFASPMCAAVHNEAAISPLAKGSMKGPAPRPEDLSSDYREVSEWLYNALRDASLVDTSTEIHTMNFEKSGEIDPKWALTILGAVPKTKWKSKASVHDPKVEEMILTAIEDALKMQIRELRDSTSVGEKNAAKAKAQQKILEAFDRTFGPLPERFEFQGTTYTPVEFQRKFFPNSADRTLEPTYSLERMIKTARSENTQIESPLSHRQNWILNHHDITRWAQKIGDGSNLTFGSLYSGLNIVKTAKGEKTQFQFMKKVLQQLFPKADFKGRYEDPSPGRKKVNLWAVDLAERFPGMPDQIRRFEDPGLVVSMNLGKAANTSGVRLGKNVVRKNLGIPLDRKVVHMYLRSEDTMDGSHFAELLKAIETAFPIDILIVSIGNHTEGYDLKKAGLVDAFRGQVAGGFTGVLSGPLPRRVLIENGTIGKMKELHEASDLAVVVGPVNFFEPIHMGTPTLLIGKNDSQNIKSDYGSYDATTLKEFAELAKKSGIFEWIPSSKNRFDYRPVGALVQKLMTAEESPESVSDIAFQRYLSALMKHLNYRMNNPNPADYQGLNIE